MKSGEYASAAFVVALAAMAMLAGCQSAPARPAQSGSQQNQVLIEPDIVYTTYGETKMLLDMARPAGGEGPFPVVLFLFGGGFKEGSKSDMRLEAVLAAQRGYIGVAINYRLTTPLSDPRRLNQFPAQIHDVKAAIRWLRENAAKYAIDPGRIGVVGFSAGAILALMAGFTGPKDGLEGEASSYEYSSEVQAVVSAGGTADLAERGFSGGAYIEDAMRRYLGGSPTEQPDRYRLASPAMYVTLFDPSVLAIYGSADTAVPVGQAQILAERMLATGARVSILVVPQAGHDFYQLASPGTEYPMWSFLDLHLKPR